MDRLDLDVLDRRGAWFTIMSAMISEVGRNKARPTRIGVGGITAIAVLLAVSVGDAAVQAQPAIEREIRSALASMPHAQTAVGACVIDLTTGKTVFTQDADKPLIPASTMKVFTMTASLAVLGSQFSFETRFATDGTNIFIIGDGDPALGDEKLCKRRGEAIDAVFERWADVLVEAGVRSIPGDIIVDESIFDDRRTHPSWDEADLDNWYAAPVGGLNFNDNCVDITIRPGEHIGDRVQVSVQPDSALIKIINKCKTATGKSTPILHHQHDTFEYEIRKSCNKKWRFGPVSFPDPGLLAGDSLRNVLIRKGIEVSGYARRERVRLIDGSLPPSLTILGRHRTPIADVLNRAGKNSQNLFADCLLKRAGYAWAEKRGADGAQGTWQLGAEAVIATLQSAGIDTANLAVADGSGLSRANLCTPRQLVRTLAWMQTQPAAQLFLDSLSNAGVDGSLRKRLKDVPNRVFAKTGTMRSVRSLCGYVDATGGGRYAFAVMFNGYKGPSTPYKDIQDRICRALIKSGTPRNSID